MDYQVDNKGFKDKAIGVYGDLAIVKAGNSEVVKNAYELTEEQIASLAADECFVTLAKEKPKAEPKAEAKAEVKTKNK